MHAWEAIQKTVDYIEENLSEEITITQLADIAYLSEFYYQRLFSRLVKKPVREYIKLRRLALASQRLQNSKARILDIALDCGFHSHETLTKAFKQAFSVTPEQFRLNPVRLNQFDKPDLLLNYTLIDEGVPLIREGLVLEFNRKTLKTPISFLGITGYIPLKGQMSLGEETSIDALDSVWERFHAEKHLIPRIEKGREVGTAFWGDAPEGHFTYFTGAEVPKNVKDSRFVKWELPAREYIVCGFEAENFEQLVTASLNKAGKYCALWLEKHNLVMDGYSPEIYYDSTPTGNYMEMWLPFQLKI